MAQRSELVDLTLVQFYETHNAYLVGETGDREKGVWLPKSLCERGPSVGTEQGRYGIYEFTVEAWLAEDKKLV